MSTFGSLRHSQMYSCSQHSSSGSNGSFDATPESKLTAFSPEDRKMTAKSYGPDLGGALLTAGSHDPFVTTHGKNKEVKLSATASTFQPFGNISGPNTASASHDHVPSSSSTTTNTLGYRQSEALNAGDVDEFGMFTTETGASRCMKVTSIYGANARNLVEESLAKIAHSDYVRGGAEPRVLAIDNKTVFIREANIADAAHTYNTVKLDGLGDLEVSYITPAIFGQVVSPTTGALSTHEGQIILEVKYHVSDSTSKSDVEKKIIKLLSSEGPLCAWMKLPTQEGTFCLLAEFYDSSFVPRAVQRLNQKHFEVALDVVSVAAKPYTPDNLGLYNMDISAPNTPTHQIVDRLSRLSDQLGGMAVQQTPDVAEHHVPSGGYSLNMPTNTTPQSVNQPGPYAHMFNRSPASVERSNAYSTSMATQRTNSQRTPVSVNRSQAFGAQNSRIQTPSSIGRSNAYMPPTMGSSLAYLPSNSFAMPQGLPVMVGGLYSPTPVNSLRQPLATPTHYSDSVMQTMGQHLYASPPMYQYPGRDPSSVSPVAYQHQCMGMGYSPATPVNNTRVLESFDHSSSGGRRQNAIKVPPHAHRHHLNAAGQHNHVDIARIQEGMDIKTTVMLRNIPNKVDQAMLKEIIDESSFGRYDFMYLRIDFSNNCNVGYAFINFVDPLDIVQFVQARSNQKWHRFKSDKVAEVSYATIQGRDCLIQKFRNSSVMLEPAHYRPKLFFTVHDPLNRAGLEENFPGSDNPSKLKRSCENAEHVGLFAPSAGQHLRDEQRRRRSQYDRGTSLAEREEYDLEAYGTYDNTQGFYNSASY